MAPSCRRLVARSELSLVGQIITDEIKEINAANERHVNTVRYASSREKYNPYKLAEAAIMEHPRLYRYLRGKRMTLHTLMRLIAVLGPSEARATEIIHAAGFDISTDGQQENADYRAIIALGAGHTEEKNRILQQRGRPGIIRAFVRY